MNMDQKVGRGSFRAGVQEQLVDAVNRADLRSLPFDHIYMEDVLDQATYSELLAAMPDRHFFHDLMHQDARRSEGGSTRLRMYLYPELIQRLPEEQSRAWMRVSEALCSPVLELAFKRKFRRALEERFGKSVEEIGTYPVPILLRDQPGYRIGIHSDVKRKAITVQFYLPEDDTQEHLGTLFHDRNDGSGTATQMPFLPSSGYAFPVSLAKSWHSAAETSQADGERISMMVTYYVADGPIRRAYWKIRRALLSIGIHSSH
ncbi:MAG TPA: hypothetical protein VJ846_02420 [Sphingomicrobium sp.]|nr:hypothetical protein [Sphingomicrobium sp.]